MTGQELKLIFKDGVVYLTPDSPMALQQIGYHDFSKKMRPPAYWIVKVLRHIEAEQRMFCEVLAYRNGDTQFDHYQQLVFHKLRGIKKLSFRSVDTAGLLRTLPGVQSWSPSNIDTNQIRADYQSEPIARESTKKIINESFSVFLKNVSFKNGCALFHQNIKQLGKTVEVTIFNPTILEEYDAVKNYFSNLLGSKKINGVLHIEAEGDKIFSIFASSVEIERINNAMIDQVKLEIARFSSKGRISEGLDKKLLTMEEYVELTSDKQIKACAFFDSDKELFDSILKVTDTKHYQHLRYLSSKHCYGIMRLRFVLKPCSFVFLLEGENNYYIIWETLDTEEATYIWNLPKNLDAVVNALPKIDNSIKRMKAHGKIEYIQTTNDELMRVYHDYSGSSDGFVKWKREIDTILSH